MRAHGHVYTLAFGQSLNTSAHTDAPIRLTLALLHISAKIIYDVCRIATVAPHASFRRDAGSAGLYGRAQAHPTSYQRRATYIQTVARVT